MHENKITLTLAVVSTGYMYIQSWGYSLLVVLFLLRRVFLSLARYRICNTFSGSIHIMQRCNMIASYTCIWYNHMFNKIIPYDNTIYGEYDYSVALSYKSFWSLCLLSWISLEIDRKSSNLFSSYTCISWIWIVRIPFQMNWILMW